MNMSSNYLAWAEAAGTPCTDARVLWQHLSCGCRSRLLLDIMTDGYWLASRNADHLAAGVGESILEQASDCHAALIVLGSRGMGALKRYPLSLLPPPHPSTLFMRLHLHS